MTITGQPGIYSAQETADRRRGVDHEQARLEERGQPWPGGDPPGVEVVHVDAADHDQAHRVDLVDRLLTRVDQATS
jgi:hypothetical protein